MRHIRPGFARAAAICLLGACLATTARAAEWLYLTVQGDTLIGISQRYLKDPRQWPTLQQLNRVDNTRQLPTNTRLRIPVELLKSSPAPAMVKHVEGNVRIRPGGGTFRPLKAGDAISGGETVLTGPRSFASYVLADGSKVNQADSTKLVFGKLAVYGNTGMVSTELNLESGRVEADASKQTLPGTGFKVTTPVAVAGLRGTSFRLNMAEDGKTLRNEVLGGGVGIAAQGTEVLVGAGFGTLAQAGKPPEPPRPLLPAPDTSNLPARIVDAPVRFAWLADPKAQAWRAQIARDAEFREVLFDNVFWQPVATWREPSADGPYHLRLRAIDSAGLEGLNRDHAFEMDIRPYPPAGMAPTDGARLGAKRVDFAWSAAAAAAGYLLQIARDPMFKDGIQEHRIAKATSTRVDLAEGVHFWRLASLDDGGRPHGWGKPATFSILAPPAAPSDVQAGMSDGALRIAWRGDAPEYRIEIARDPAFQEIVGRHLAFQHEVRLNKPAAGSYWLRVVPYDKDGDRGEAGPVVAVKVPDLF